VRRARGGAAPASNRAEETPPPPSLGAHRGRGGRNRSQMIRAFAGAAHRLRSGEFPRGAGAYGDPRAAAVAHVDATIVRDAVADASGAVASLCYAHRSRTRPGAPATNPALPERAFVWVLLHAATRRALGVAPGVSLRIYDPLCFPNAAARLVRGYEGPGCDFVLLDAQLCERAPAGEVGAPPPAAPARATTVALTLAS